MVDGYVKRKKPGERRWRRWSKQLSKTSRLDSEKVKAMPLDNSQQHFEVEVIDLVVTNQVFLAVQDPETKTISLIKVPFSPKWTVVPKWSVLGKIMLSVGASTVGELKGKKITLLKQGGRLTI